MALFEPAYKRFIQPFEGGYVNNPNDRGGETYAGISRVHNPQENDLWTTIDFEKRARYNGTIPRGTKFPAIQYLVDAFYKSLWEKHRLSEIKSQGVATMFFDFIVNSGATKAVKILQKLVGTTADGIVGPITLGAVNKSNERDLLTRLTEARKDFYFTIVENDDTQKEFLAGWLNRLNTLANAFINSTLTTALLLLLLVAFIYYYSKP